MKKKEYSAILKSYQELRDSNGSNRSKNESFSNVLKDKRNLRIDAWKNNRHS